MKKPLGRNNLGDGGKMSVEMHGFGSTNFNLSEAHTLTMSAGTLVPYYQAIMLPGSKMTAKLHCDVMTLPTIGMMFGRYKVQIDWFATPMSLFNGLPMVNEFNLGKNVDKIKFPHILVDAMDIKKGLKRGIPEEIIQINPSSRLFYNGIRYLGYGKSSDYTHLSRIFNAMSMLVDDDIYLRYYANPQEEEGAFIHHDITGVQDNITATQWNDNDNGQAVTAYPMAVPIEVWNNELTTWEIWFDSEEAMNAFNLDRMKLKFKPFTPTYDVLTVSLDDLYQNFDYDWYELKITAKNIRINGINTIHGFEYIEYDGDSPIQRADVEPAVKRFPLSDISDLRKELLKKSLDGLAYRINRETEFEPYKSILEFNVNTAIGAKMFAQEGLYVITYQSDMFTNWVNQEYISGANGVNELTKIETDEDGNFTIDQLIFNRKLYDALMRVDVAGGQIDDYIEVSYDYERRNKIQGSMYIGGLSREIAFQEVVSNTGTTDQPLGTIAGKGILTEKNRGGKIEISVEQPTIVKGYISIKPRVVYSQGNDWFNDLEDWSDLHRPSFDNIGFQDLISDSFAAFDTELDMDSPWKVIKKGYGKQPAWTHYKTTIDRASGAFAIKNEQMWQTLNRRFESYKTAEGKIGIRDFTAYIDPRKYNYVFANARRDAMNFQVNLFTDVHMRRKMAGSAIPNL